MVSGSISAVSANLVTLGPEKTVCLRQHQSGDFSVLYAPYQ